MTVRFEPSGSASKQLVCSWASTTRNYNRNVGLETSATDFSWVNF